MSKDDYEVGYGKPPKSGQFQKGKSGNPKGRKKGSQNLATQLRKAMDQKIEVRSAGKTNKMSVQEAFVAKLIHSAMNGTTSDQIRLLNALDKFAPELLKMPVEPLEQLEVVFVHSDGKGGILREKADEHHRTYDWSKENGGDPRDPLDM